MIGVIQVLWLSVASLAWTGEQPALPRPLHLQAEAAGTDVRIRVTGQSAVACNATYALEVSSSSGAGSNRSVQHGVAHLQAHTAPVTLATVVLGNSVTKNWRAQLSVHSCGGVGQYDETAATK